MTRELWEVTLEVDGRRETTVVTIEPPFGIRQADAEVKAIRSAEREGASEVRALRSRFIREETAR